MKKRFFKGSVESDLGSGILYIEFVDEYATRQVEIYNGQWFYSKDDYHSGIGDSLADQPLSEMDLTEADEITEKVFEDIWEKACEYLDKK